MNKRLIILNTLVSYGRSLLTVGLTLFSTRWVLEALGKSDLGLYYAIGGIVVFLSFINTSMAFSSQRHFAFALGHGGTNDVQDWFNSSLSLHLAFAGAFLVLSIPLGVFAFRYWLTIPEMRVSSCQWVYVCSVLTAASAIISVPFNAIYIAKQRIYELTVIQLFQTLFLFALAWLLLRYQGDKLRAYALGTLLITVFVYLAQVIRCKVAFVECQVDVHRMMSKCRYKELLSFSGWSLTSTFAYILRGQGVALLLNNFGTSGVNAAYGIANNVSGQVGFLSGGLMNAVAPEITKLEGGGHHEEMVRLSIRACKFATLLILFLFIPIMTDVEPLLVLWLKDVPEHTPEFVRMMMVAFLAVQMVLGVTAATKAFGKIAKPEIWASLALLIAVPLGYALIVVGFAVVYVVAVVALTAILCALSTLVWARLLFQYPLLTWMREVLVQNFAVAAFVFCVNYVLHQLMQPSFIRLVTAVIFDGALLIVLGWFFVLDLEERTFVCNRLKRQYVNS